MGGKAPAFMYYPKDWRSDPVWCCSLAARGLWHEMMDRMHESKPYGYLCANGKPIPPEQIARLCGTTLSEFNVLLAELDAVGVPRRTASGIIYCKRMVEDERKRKEWRNRQNKKRLTERDISQVSRDCHADLHLHSASPSQNHNPPYPPSGGEETFSWGGQTVAVQMGRHKRLPKLDAYQGGRASDVVQFLKSRGFEARVVSVQ